MTTTIPQQQTDEIQIVRKPPTIEQAQLLVQIETMNAVSGANRGFGLLARFDNPPTLAQLRKKHPLDSAEYQCIQSFLQCCEMVSTFVKQDLLSEDLVKDLYWVDGAWRVSEKVCKGMRREAGEPRIFANFEALASRAT